MARGRSRRSPEGKTVPTSGESVCTRGRAADTSTDCVTSPTSRLTSTRSTWATFSSKPVRTSLLKLATSKATWYGPGGRLGTVYWPASVVVVSKFTFVAVFVTMTRTCGIKAPVVSVTVPVIVPRLSCAKHESAMSNRIAPNRLVDMAIASSLAGLVLPRKERSSSLPSLWWQAAHKTPLSFHGAAAMASWPSNVVRSSY